MGRLSFIPAACDDLLELWVTIASNNPAAADRTIDRIEGACSHLRQHPNLGPARPEIGVGARALIIDRWLALYKVELGVFRSCASSMALAISTISYGLLNKPMQLA